MRSVTEWYETMGYPGFNPFLPRARSRSPRQLKKRSRSRSRSASSGRKRKRSMSPESSRKRSRSREFDARGGDVSGRWKHREGSRQYGTSEKETRPLKQSQKISLSKQEPKPESRSGKSQRDEKLKVKESWSSEVSAKDKAAKKGLRTRSTDDSYKLPKSEDFDSKQTESVQRLVDHQPSVHKVVSDEKFSGTGVKKLPDFTPIPLVQTYPYADGPSLQPKKVMPLLAIKLPSRFTQAAAETTHCRKVISESVPQKETFKADQKHAAATTEQTSHSELDRDKTVVASKKVDKSAISEPTDSEAVIPLEQIAKEKVETPVAPVTPLLTEPTTVPLLLTESLLPEPVVEKSSAVSMEVVTSEKEEVLLPVSSEQLGLNSKVEPEQALPLHAAAEKAAPQQPAAEKTEVSAKNVAQVKPLLVASVPEKSRWERETDVVSERDSAPVLAARDRDRLPATTKTSLPR